MTDQEKNKRLIQYYVDAFNQGNLETLKTLFAPDAVIQGVLGKGQMEHIMPIWRQLVDGLGMQLTIEEIISEGPVVAVRFTEHGTFKAPFFGHQPTGKSYQLTAMEWFVVRNGKIHQRWAARDQASQARQLGMSIE